MFEKIYIDLDGVLADFDKGFEDRHKVSASEYEAEHGAHRMWEKVYEDPRFFLNLTPFPDVSLILRLCARATDKVIILSSPSRINTSLCVQQKRTWVDKNIGYHFPAIFESEKHKFAGPNRLLIDDTVKKVDKWVETGGIGHVYTDYYNLLGWMAKRASLVLKSVE